jgi:hypothetical protein
MPAVITHCLPLFHSTPCTSSSSSQHSERLESRSSCGRGVPYTGPAISLHCTVSLVQWVNRCFPSRGPVVRFLGMHKPTQWNRVSPVSASLYNGVVIHCRKKQIGLFEKLTSVIDTAKSAKKPISQFSNLYKAFFVFNVGTSN